MSIEEIEKRILQEAEAEASKIKKACEETIAQLKKVHTKKIEGVKSRALRIAQQKAEDITRSYLVPARLLAKKNILEKKQNIMGQIYGEIQKEKKLSNVEINKLKEDTEIKAAFILFGKQVGE